jgi:sugar (pentulose or hexulose) kinase
MECLVGIDVGTTSTRVAIYGVDGQLLSDAASSHDITHPRLGWAEQNADVWWNGVVTATRCAMDKFIYPADSIKGIAITSMRQTFVCLDCYQKPLRPAILWYDTRHAAQVDWVRSTIGNLTVYELTGSPPGRRTVYKVMWLKENEPHIYDATFRIVFIPDYILLRLTGELATTPGVSFASGCLDVSNPTQWAENFIIQCGLEPDKWVPTIKMPGVIAGLVTKSAASVTGFPEGTPVVLAAGDQACGNLGVGVCKPGILGINGGTSCALQTPSQRLPLIESMDHFVDFSPAGYYVAENGITSGTAALTEWFRDNFGHPEITETNSEGKLWDALYELANLAPPGNMGMMVVPYFRGANGPLWDPRARGVIVGLSTDHGREHLMRGLLEGLAFESRRILENMERGTDIEITSVRSYGGASNSDIWNQIFADVLGRPVTVSIDPSPVSLGAAIAAGYGVGLYRNPVDAAERMVQTRKIYEPNPLLVDLYSELYHEVYLHLYSPMSALINTTSRIITSKSPLKELID